MPEELQNVKKEPPRFPSTGLTFATATSLSYILEGLPILSEAAYTVKLYVQAMSRGRVHQHQSNDQLRQTATQITLQLCRFYPLAYDMIAPNKSLQLLVCHQ